MAGFLATQLIPEPLRGQILFWVVVGFLPGIVILVVICAAAVAIRRSRSRLISSSRAEFAWQKSVEDRLDELERLKRRDMVTPEEYAAKHQEILKDL
jgi:cytochrome c-type biogenesis protein CcmI